MKNFTVTIELDCTPRLEALLQRTIVALFPTDNKHCMQAEAHTLNVAVTTDVVPGISTNNDEQDSKPKTDVKSQIALPKEITNDDIRSHIKACRERVLSDLSGDAYAAAHNVLNQQLRNKVAEFGVEKASELPQEHRSAFIAYCDSINDVNTEPF